MPRIHLVTGHRQINRGDAPVVLYCGQDGAAAKAVQEQAVAAGAALIADRFTPTSPVTRFADSLAPLVKADAAPGKVDVVLIPVEIGAGDDKTIINVTSDAEAKFVRDLEAARALAVEETAKAQAETLNVMQECDRLRKLSEGMDTANQRLATYEADLKSRDATIAELEARLEKKTKPK